MNEIQEDSINFIKHDVIPEMVHNRCFCECGSREFVEFDSIMIEPLKTVQVKNNCEFYRAQVTIKFSGEAKIFPVIIKLLPHNALNDEYAYGRFLNEEMFYSKMVAVYQLDIFPKCYGADMGRYGRPVIVLEDLEAMGYSRPSVLLDEDHLKLCLMAIGKFHARGIKLKKNNFEKFREFYAKITECNSEKIDNTFSFNKTVESVVEHIPGNLNETTICHGKFNTSHILFQHDHRSKPTAVKILGWNQIKYMLPIIDLQSIINNDAVIGKTELNNEFKSIEKNQRIQTLIDFYCGAIVKELNSS